jgi:hypothetical protein
MAFVIRDLYATRMRWKMSAPSEAYSEEIDPTVWGTRAISEIIDRTERQTFYLLEQGLLPAKKVGGQWCGKRSKLRAFPFHE